jgi:quinol monooxygenase YgiN
MAKASFRIVVDTPRADDVLAVFRSQMGPTQCRSGFIGCSLERDVDRPGAIRFHTTWENQAHLRAFINSEVMDRVLQLLELSVEKPEILVCCGDEAAGLTSVLTLRDESGAAAVQDHSPCRCCDALEETGGIE